MTRDRAWSRVSKTDRALAIASPEEARRILRKSLRAALRTVLTGRQGLREVHAAHVARTGICTCSTGEPNPFHPGFELDLCRRMGELNASVARALAALEDLGLPEPGEDKAHWRLD